MYDCVETGMQLDLFYRSLAGLTYSNQYSSCGYRLCSTNSNNTSRIGIQCFL